MRLNKKTRWYLHILCGILFLVIWITGNKNLDNTLKASIWQPILIHPGIYYFVFYAVNAVLVGALNIQTGREAQKKLRLTSNILVGFTIFCLIMVAFLYLLPSDSGADHSLLFRYGYLYLSSEINCCAAGVIGCISACLNGYDR